MKINTNGSVTDPKGFLAAGIDANIRNKKGKYDLAMISSEYPTTTAGVYTQNVFKAAPVSITKQHIDHGNPRAIVVNSRIANACTGDQGIKDARDMASTCSEVLGISASEVVVASTGLIGEYLPMEAITKGVKQLSPKMSAEGGIDAASAIMTTDTKEKHISVTKTISGKKVTVGGIAKGSGMIHPNMATMLAFLTTDCAIDKNLLQSAMSDSTSKTYNMITVDGDTSTNDMVVCLANGCANNPAIVDKSEEYQQFLEMINYVNKELAKQIVMDGEGASKLIEVTVSEANSFQDAKAIAMSVLNSNLVKTAFFGKDANWGRIICAMGYAGVEFDPNEVDIYLGDLQVMRKGKGVDFDEDAAAKILEDRTIQVKIDLGLGTFEATGYGSDLSYDYITINGSYRS